MASAQLYRQSKLGDCLVEALDDLINAGKLNPELAMRVLTEYDTVRGSHPPRALPIMWGRPVGARVLTARAPASW